MSSQAPRCATPVVHTPASDPGSLIYDLRSLSVLLTGVIMTFAPPSEPRPSARIRILGCEPPPEPPRPARRLNAGLIAACAIAALTGIASAVLARELFPQNPPTASAPPVAPQIVDDEPVDVGGTAMIHTRPTSPQIARMVRGPQMTPLPAAARHAARAAEKEKIVSSTEPMTAAAAAQPAPVSAPPPATGGYVTSGSPTTSTRSSTGGQAPAAKPAAAHTGGGSGPAQPADPTDPNAAASRP